MGFRVWNWFRVFCFWDLVVGWLHIPLHVTWSVDGSMSFASHMAWQNKDGQNVHLIYLTPRRLTNYRDNEVESRLLQILRDASQTVPKRLRAAVTYALASKPWNPEPSTHSPLNPNKLKTRHFANPMSSPRNKLSECQSCD